MPEKGETLNQIIYMGYAFGKAAQAILAEIGIAEMLSEILKHQRESRGGVAKVMNKESGHSLECLHFLVLNKSARHFQIAERAGDLVSDAREQIKILSAQGPAVDPVSQSYQANMLGPRNEREADTVAAVGEMIGIELPQGFHEPAGACVKVNGRRDPAKELEQPFHTARAREQVSGLFCSERAGCTEGQAPAVFVGKPNGDGKDFESVGDQCHNRAG